ncbi:MAG: hypothetical protein LBF75_11065 [Treponema sp.]|jgi:hypothetical protein|nr:hypothetical protein [Treponema sp.]
MPHEQLPDPDWTKASDKNAADWQAEAGIGDLPEAEKEKVITQMIADTNPKHFSASKRAGLSAAKKHEEGIADPKESVPGTSAGNPEWGAFQEAPLIHRANCFGEVIHKV